MKESVNKQLEELSGKIIREASIERPFFDFTNTVMSQVESLKSSSSIIEYKPLISRRSWAIIILSLFIFTGLALFGKEEHPISWFSSFNLSSLVDIEFFESLFSFKMPKYMSYSIIFFCLMICMQIPLLKYYFNKRLEH